MREFYEVINEYPWTTFFLFIMVTTILSEIACIVHRDK